MMRKGLLIFNHMYQEWRGWIGQTPYWIDQGYSFELRIQNRYLEALLEKDLDWFVTLEQDVIFALHTNEVYKIRVDIQDSIPVNAPF